MNLNIYKVVNLDEVMKWPFSLGVHSFNPGKRIFARVEPFAAEIKLRGTSKQKEELKLYEDNLERVFKKLRFTYWGRNVAFFLVYFAFFSMFLRNVRLFFKAIEMISLVISVVGTAVLFLIMTLLDKFTELYVDDILVISTHITVIYHKLPVSKQKEAVKKRRKKVKK